jgi:hypothetical protein
MIQSNYIPWRGYFDFIDDVDLFIFYDDVQYTHKDWRNRNKIKTPNGLMWLSVPVVHDSSTLIQDAQISYESRWVDKHIRSLAIEYGKSPFFKLCAEEFFGILRNRPRTISDLNVAACRWAMHKLDITTKTMMSSEVGVAGDKFDRPLEILKKLGATSYLSGPTAKNYTDPQKFKEAGIGLEFKTYVYKQYPQLHGAFEPHVTILDLLFNCGASSRSYLKSLVPNERVSQ